MKMKGQSVGEELSKASSESECESDTSVVHIDGWEDVTMGDRKPKAYTFTKNAGPQFNHPPDAEPMPFILVYFSMMIF
jgi:hypothetical protein